MFPPESKRDDEVQRTPHAGQNYSNNLNSMLAEYDHSDRFDDAGHEEQKEGGFNLPLGR